MSKIISWSDRFALIDHYTPSDAAICAAFNLTQAELDTARNLRAQGTFVANANLDVAKFDSLFAATTPATQPAAMPVKTPTATVHSRPESATKQPKVPQKRGRKGNKITTALQAVPTTPMPVEMFIQQHGVSLAVLRQAKRFVEALPATEASTIGTVHVRQDRATKQLMIWKDQS
jgi:hypothetical protein